MEIKTIPLKRLSTNDGQIDGIPKNPRFIRDERFQALKKSLAESPEMTKLRELIVYPLPRGRFATIGGNMRLRAMRDLNWTETICKVLPLDTPKEKLAEYAIKDNVPFGQDDYDILANEWSDFPLAEWGMPLVGADIDLDQFFSQDHADHEKELKRLVLDFASEAEHDEVVEALNALDGTNEEIVRRLLGL